MMTIKNLLNQLIPSPSLRSGLGAWCMLLAGQCLAQDADPFGEVNTAKYQNTMTITGQVVLGSDTLGSETVVAVYQADELRGKGSPLSQGKYSNILMMNIFGETKGQPLHFKVWTGGRVIEVDQGMTFVTDKRNGTLKEPYIIDVPVPIVTTTTTEGWATTCLPYNALVPEGVTVWNATGIADGELLMEKAEGNILPKQTPVLLQVASRANLEWLARVAESDIKAEGSILRGTTESTAVEANSVLTLGHSDTTGEVGFWLYTGTTVPANRAYIVDFPAATRGVTLHSDDTTTSVFNMLLEEAPTVVDLQGRMVPAAKVGRLLWKKGRHGQIIKIR